jgi:hypothetical protein
VRRKPSGLLWAKSRHWGKYQLEFCAVSLRPVGLASKHPKGRNSIIGLDQPAEKYAKYPPTTKPLVLNKAQKSATTLGDVLYAKSKAPASEQEWVALVRCVAAGDQLALHALYERAHRPVFTLIMRITADRETAEEVTIDVFHDIWRHASRYDAATGTVLGWIMNQTRSRAIDLEPKKTHSNSRGATASRGNCRPTRHTRTARAEQIAARGISGAHAG